MRRHTMQVKAWGWGRILVLSLAFALALFAGLHQMEGEQQQQLRAQAAQQLAGSVLEEDSGPASPASAGAASTPTKPATASPTTSASRSSSAVSTPSIALPPRKFAWPAAGLSVDLVPMQWSSAETVDPPLDANGFDPVGHWLMGTGQSAAVRPVVIAGHTCHMQVALCTDATFPFNRLSYAGWALGQPATLTDASGRVNCSLTDRKIVDKSKAFSFANDPCQVVAFSCDYTNPDGQIVLLTFGCGQCT